jgi:hypothetical protein
LLPEKKQGVKKKLDVLHGEWRKSISSRRSFLVITSFTALLILFFSSVPIVNAGRITLEWDPVTHPDLAGYMVYYGTFSEDYDESVDVGNWTSVTIEGLEEDVTYYFSVTAYSADGEESEYSNEVCNNSAICATASSSGGGGGGCFIAAAADGFRMAEEARILRNFYEKLLLTNPLGRAWVRFYSKVSPQLADSLSRHETSRVSEEYSFPLMSHITP